ncbi:GTP cyclohydrolase IIa [Halalkaliarchaeum desulfuricum]|uniref:GTP cyclohydrolase III n=2 Tax=Halalkaliarchaeum desulfuricum TaxID=2055893 RepID=A0A343TM28_9EURY|nr:GTP cyclohydrolase IIa [Halalkaliarchaeum desulfuricum]AUX10150.1 GTP cyclohydrolase IIa [Halalkaliarchaeum desulfuricum]
MVQVTVLQLDNYGPWTVTPNPRRETDLQALQARLYADLCQQFGLLGGYVFYGRFDNLIAFTDGISKREHGRIQQSIDNLYPVSVSMSIGRGNTPKQAVEIASANLQEQGSSQDADRSEVLVEDEIDELHTTAVGVAHFDVVDVTDKITDEENAYEACLSMESVYSDLMRRMYADYDALSFFVGGDNIISVTPKLSDSALDEVIVKTKQNTNVQLQVGYGLGDTPSEAGMQAKHNLELCREKGTVIERDRAVVERSSAD